MKNFEHGSTSIVENSNELNREVSDFISNKINPVLIAARESGFNLNNPNFLKKINKLSDNVVEKFFSGDDQAESVDIESIKREILKMALEDLAKNDFGGSLGMYEDLENKYLELLVEEALLRIKNNSSSNNLYDSEFIKNLCDKLNKKNILDNNRKGKLFDKIKSLIDEEELKNVA